MVSADDIGSPPPLTPPRSLPPPPIRTTTLNDPSEGPSSSYSYNPSLLIIAAILAFVCIASASIHLLLRFLSRSSSSSSSPPLMHRSGSSNSATTATSSSSASDQDRKALLDSLPLFSLASSLAALPKSSPDCAVCLSRFQPHDELRLLPSCRHAFHSPCIDTWIRSTPSCPLCRSSIDLPPPPPPPPPTPPSPPAAEQNPGTGSFRLEIGSVSRRRTQEEDQRAPPAPPPHPRSYPLGPSFEYQVEEEVEAVVSRLRRRPAVEKQEDPVNGTGPLPPGAEVADAVGGMSKAWLKEYVDRLASSASSSFSSLRFSSRRFDGGSGGSWDLEGDGNGEESGHWVSYRWLTGAPS